MGLPSAEARLRDDGSFSSFGGRERLIHIVDPELSTCEALSVVLRLEGYRTAFFLDTASFRSAFGLRLPEVVILNRRIGRDDGLALLRHIKALHPYVPVLVIEDRPQVDEAVLAMQRGAASVFAKPLDMNSVVRAVREALRRSSLRGDHRRASHEYGISRLTPRERQVLQLIAGGQSNKEAGRALGISPRTVEVHRSRVMEKLGVRNTAELMRIVMET